ncbi:MAG: hypothetical protein H6838_01790 [Planctomycetes bacterium]|nr:hypothetical protein [Planctomycetota bacterium]
MSTLGKALLVGIALPLSMWVGTVAYWSLLRQSGEAPAYYVATMVFFRFAVLAPLQVLSVSGLAIAHRRDLSGIRLGRIVLACCACALVAPAADALGLWAMYGRGQPGFFWYCVPLALGPVALIILKLSAGAPIDVGVGEPGPGPSE